MASSILYSVVISLSTLKQIRQYQQDLASGAAAAGCYLNEQLTKFKKEESPNAENATSSQTSFQPSEPEKTWDKIALRKFIDLLLATKKPLKFAESGVTLDGGDWNEEEFKILGNINIAVPVEIYDNGVWSVSDKNFKEYKRPFDGELLFTPGPLLGARTRNRTPDHEAVITDGKINQKKYNELIEQRLAPLLAYASTKASDENKEAFVTIPGIGCGAFAGRFRGTVGKYLNNGIQFVIEKYSKLLTGVSCVYFVPFQECNTETKIINNIEYRVRPFQEHGKSQLHKPVEYQENQDDFSNCKLFKIVAWDHVSYPGNDFYALSRMTDDGVSAAATNSMKIITGVEGKYENGKYKPLNYSDWEEVVHKKKINLKAHNLIVISEDQVLTLEDAEKMLN